MSKAFNDWFSANRETIGTGKTAAEFGFEAGIDHAVEVMREVLREGEAAIEGRHEQAGLAVEFDRVADRLERGE